MGDGRESERFKKGWQDGSLIIRDKPSAINQQRFMEILLTWLLVVSAANFVFLNVLIFILEMIEPTTRKSEVVQSPPTPHLMPSSSYSSFLF